MTVPIKPLSYAELCRVSKLLILAGYRDEQFKHFIRILDELGSCRNVRALGGAYTFPLIRIYKLLVEARYVIKPI
jgi:hypothetical protein